MQQPPHHSPLVHLWLQIHQHSSLAAAPAGAQKAWVAGKYLLGLGAAVAASQTETVAEKARLAYLIPVRLLRDVHTAASIVTGVCSIRLDVRGGCGQLHSRCCSVTQQSLDGFSTSKQRSITSCVNNFFAMQCSSGMSCV